MVLIFSFVVAGARRELRRLAYKPRHAVGVARRQTGVHR